ncbi:MAG: glycosyltransferase [Candidatus Limnocylindrales bacterium]
MPHAPLPKALRDEVERLGKADIMVGIPSFRNAATIGHVARAAQAGLVQYFPDLRPVLVNADAGSPDGTQRVVVETEPPDYVERILLVRPRNRLQRISLTYPQVEGIGGKGAALLTIFRIAHALDVEALVVVDSDLRSIVPEWIELLAGPILKGGFDFVAPLYTRFKWDGTITNTVTYPLTRALYGLRIRQPIGGDFGVSGDLIAHYLAQDDWTPDVSRFGIDIWMTTHAIAGGFAVAQTRLGAKVHDPKDPGADLGPMFSQVVATLLRLTERHAERWLDVHGSHDVPAYGFERLGDPPPLQVNVGRLLEEFGRGLDSVGEAWHTMLAPETAEVAERLAADAGEAAARLASGETNGRTPAGGHGAHGQDETVPAVSFSLPDETWARIIYDTAIAFHARALPLPRLVAALVPLYFGRVASLVLETRDLTTEEAEAFVERQARAFELAKPYLVERWRRRDVAGSSAVTVGRARTTKAKAGQPRTAAAAPRRRERKP